MDNKLEMSSNNKDSYHEMLEWMFRQLPMYQRKGKKAFKKDLTNIRALCNHLHQPQDSYPVIHIAGTNGKGTVAHMLAAMLQAQGLKVGLYTSPHYIDFRERIKINGTFIKEEDVINFIQNNRSVIAAIKPSFFEMTVAMAFDFFRSQMVDIAVIETGLGGKLDSTNIVHPILSIITNISLDHQQMLGETIPQIASEKAGIIKKEVPVIIGEHNECTDDVFIVKAEEMCAELSFAEDEWTISSQGEKRNCCQFIVRSNLGKEKYDVKFKNYNPFHRVNYISALEAFSKLKQTYNKARNWSLLKAMESVTSFEENTHYIGRWILLNESPRIIGDSAHNIAGLRMVMNEIKSLSFQKLHIVFGVVRDKDMNEILSLLPTNALYYFARPNIPRGLDEHEFKELAMNHGLGGKAYPSVIKAYGAAKKNADSSDLVYVGGSTFVIAEILKYKQLASNLPISSFDTPIELSLPPGMYKWCSCGLTNIEPWCDNAHRISDSHRSLKFEINKKGAYNICRCKKSKTPPYCDGTHKSI